MAIVSTNNQVTSTKPLLAALLMLVVGLSLLIAVNRVTETIIENNMRLLMVNSETKELVSEVMELSKTKDLEGHQPAINLIQFQIVKVRDLIRATLSGGHTPLGSLAAVTDAHMRGDLMALDALLGSVDSKEKNEDPKKLLGGNNDGLSLISQVSAFSEDISDDIDRIIEENKHLLVFLQVALLLIILALFFGVIVAIRRYRYALKERDRQMQEEVARRTHDLELVLEKNKDQLDGLKKANSRLVMINSSISQLQNAAGLLAVSEKSEPLLRKLIRDAMVLTNASYGAISIFDAEGKIQNFITEGVQREMADRIGGLPRGTGLLGVFYKHKEPLRIKDITQDPRFTGFPSGHLTMRSLMGVPLVIGGKCRGALYMAEKREEEEFSEDDEAVLHLYALDLGNAIERADFVRELQEGNKELQHKQEEQEKLIHQLKNAQTQLLQSEKMASIGQLAAGIAHEINNPIGYVGSNLISLQQYIDDVTGLIDEYEKVESRLPQDDEVLSAIQQHKRSLDIDFIRQDLRDILKECNEGVSRVRKIVNDLKDFSHVSGAEWQWTDIHKGIDSTLNIAHNEIKYKAKVVKEYGSLPEVECMPHQLNQVFMNLLVNAAHSLGNQGTITIRTGVEDEGVWVEITDTGMGIEPEHLSHIFEPFFTTKPVGKGTGLGLAISYNIVKKHGGHIDVDSTVGKGTTFHIWLPVKQEEGGAKNDLSEDDFSLVANKG